MGEAEGSNQEKPQGKAKEAREGSDKLLTLSEVALRTGISMPTLQRYKKAYQNRIPSVGRGRKQRYPASSLAVFEEIKSESLGRRGRPRKGAAPTKPTKSAPPTRAIKPTKAAPAPAPAARRKPGRPPKAAAPAAAPSAGGGLLTLSRVGELTGISYPTLMRYVKLYSSRLPSRGAGRSRRFLPEAVEVFKALRGESPRGRRKAVPAPPARRGRPPAAVAAVTESRQDAGFAARLRAIEKAQENLEKQLREVVRLLKQPLKVTVTR